MADPTSGTQADPSPTGDPEAGGATEGPRGHEAGSRTDDSRVPLRLFLAVGTGLAFLAVVYAATAYEEAGIVLLFLAAALSLWCGIYLWLQMRPAAVAAAADDAAVALAEGEEAHYLPHASVWPFAIGLGAATIANGLVLGTWVVVPGLAILAIGIGGWIAQSRRRD
jgi:Cytochrome c oxidase subunit IV